MSRSSQQKVKLLHIASYLLEASDGEHPLTMAQLIAYLARQGVAAERKAVYDDINALRQFGLDVQLTREPVPAYFIGRRDFEPAELKLLVDAVQASKFITERKSLQLIKKLSSLCSAAQAGQLRRQVVLAHRVKAQNESIYYNVDGLHTAILADRCVEFQYFDYTVTKEKRFRRDGRRYCVSPVALIWEDERYYLLAWDQEAERLKHYRVDRMAGVSPTPEPRRGREAWEGLDLARYSQQTFDMFSGPRRLVSLEFDERLAGAVIDRFGKEVMIMSSRQGSFTVDVPVIVSPHFYAWVFSLDGGCRLLGPPEVRQGYIEQLQRLARQHG